MTDIATLGLGVPGFQVDPIAVRRTTPAWSNDPRQRQLASAGNAAYLAAALRRPLTAILETDGATILDLQGVQRADAILELVLSWLGAPIRIFAAHPFWKRLGVDLNKAPDRSEGIGNQQLHMDFVNAATPPRYVCLYCVRSDPAGGGHTRVADLRRAISELDSRCAAFLRRPVYRDGRVTDLCHVGADINPFPVLNESSEWPLRYTGNLLESTTDGEARQALQALDSKLTAQERPVLLKAGQALIFDNRRMVHARGALGPGQDDLRPGHQRLLYQAFAQPRYNKNQ